MFDFEKSLSAADDYINKGDAVQASEKLYKCAEESIKYLAKKFHLSEYEEAKNNGKWDAKLLFKSADRLSEKINKDIWIWWDQAWVLHVEGFHEMRLNIDGVKHRAENIRNLIELAKSSL